MSRRTIQWSRAAAQSERATYGKMELRYRPHMIQFMEGEKVIHSVPASVRQRRAERELAKARNIYGASRVRLVNADGTVVADRRSRVVTIAAVTEESRKAANAAREFGRAVPGAPIEQMSKRAKAHLEALRERRAE